MLLHGLTATRRYVVMGSRVLERSGHRVIAYDARGHGRSDARARPDGIRLRAARRATCERCWTALGIERAVLAGASMGAHTVVRFALRNPERVAALGLITPAYDPAAHMPEPDAFAGWDALARGLREGGVEGFLAAYDFAPCPTRGERPWKRSSTSACPPTSIPRQSPTLWKSFRARDHSSGSRSWPQSMRQRSWSRSRDEADPSHPLAVGERYAQAIPGRVAAGGGRRPLATALADRLAGGTALELILRGMVTRGPLRPLVTSVITYGRMPEVRNWDGQTYDRISGPMQSLGQRGARSAAAHR